MTFQKEATAAELDPVALEDVVRWTDPPGPNSRMAMVVSAEMAVDAARAVRPRESMDLIAMEGVVDVDADGTMDFKVAVNFSSFPLGWVPILAWGGVEIIGFTDPDEALKREARSEKRCRRGQCRLASQLTRCIYHLVMRLLLVIYYSYCVPTPSQSLQFPE